MNILHYGLQRSGTNFFETLLSKNFKVNFLNSNKDRSSPIQKHCRLYSEKEFIPEPQYSNDIHIQTVEEFESLLSQVPEYYFIISKDPYSWFLSYKSWAQKCDWPKVNHHYIEEYNLFYKKFINLSKQSDKFIFIRYEDILNDPNLVLIQLEKKIKLKRRFFSQTTLRIPKKVAQTDNFSKTKATFYSNQEYMNRYNDNELKEVNNLLSLEVMEALNYKIINEM